MLTANNPATHESDLEEAKILSTDRSDLASYIVNPFAKIIQTGDLESLANILQSNTDFFNLCFGVLAEGFFRTCSVRIPASITNLHTSLLLGHRCLEAHAIYSTSGVLRAEVNPNKSTMGPSK